MEKRPSTTTPSRLVTLRWSTACVVLAALIALYLAQYPEHLRQAWQSATDGVDSINQAIVQQVAEASPWVNDFIPSEFAILIPLVAIGGAGLVGLLIWQGYRMYRRKTSPPRKRRVQAELELTQSYRQSSDDSKREEQGSHQLDAINGFTTGKTVLVADDDPAVTEALHIRLTKLGVNTLRSPDATLALVGAQRATPDLIIMDITMPSGNGLAVCEMLAADPKRAHIPVIVYTGSSDQKTIDRCNELGVHYVLKSTTAWEQMKPLIRELLGFDTGSESDTESSIPGEDTESTAMIAGSPDEISETPVDASEAVVETPALDTQKPGLVPNIAPKKPIAEPVDFPTAENEPVSPASGQQEEFKILCIDKNPEVGRSIGNRVKQHKIEVFSAESVDAGYLECFRKKPKAILLDSVIRDVECQDAIDRLQQHPLLKDIPVFLMEEQYDPVEARQACVLDGIVRLKKPLDVKELLAELERHACLNGEGKTHEPLKRIETPWSADASVEAAKTLPAGDTIEDRKATPEEEISESQIEPQAEADDQTAEVSDQTAQEAAEAETPAAKRPKVLCIDDDPNVSKSLAARLHPYGVDVIRAFNGTQGYWMGLDMRPDVIITDLRMPEGEGDYVFRRFQQHPLTKDVPLIILTGETNSGVKRQMLGMGAAKYITKPWDFADLLDELRRHIDLQMPASRADSHAVAGHAM